MVLSLNILNYGRRMKVSMIPLHCLSKPPENGMIMMKRPLQQPLTGVHSDTTTTTTTT
ncbi:hypothetical protein M569_13056 [Genlisea aurea]|uniref:Uncharacterized protein n=1 Tax=Genlisea aurea TaxID=192259 RepID=S8DFZ9_9LAMI|nr:hypothetical protein M569_13056 [Genlisea aurea]